MFLRRFERSELPKTESLIAGLQQIARSTDRMDRQIAELADLSRLGDRRPLSLSVQSLDLVALTRAIVQEYQTRAERHTIRFSCSEAELTGTWDAARLARCFDNVLNNAVKIQSERR